MVLTNPYLLCVIQVTPSSAVLLNPGKTGPAETDLGTYIKPELSTSRRIKMVKWSVEHKFWNFFFKQSSKQKSQPIVMQ